MYGNVNIAPKASAPSLAVEGVIEEERKQELSPNNGSLCVVSFETPETIPTEFRYEEVEQSCGVLAEKGMNRDNSPKTANYMGYYVAKALLNFGSERGLADPAEKAQESAHRIASELKSKGLLDEAGAFVFVLGAVRATGQMGSAREYLQQEQNKFSDVMEEYLRIKKKESRGGSLSLAEKELKERVEAIIEARGVEAQVKALEEWIKKQGDVEKGF